VRPFLNRNLRQNIFTENNALHLFSRTECDKMVFAEEHSTSQSLARAHLCAAGRRPGDRRVFRLPEALRREAASVRNADGCSRKEKG
jgi:hypothetical protein